MNKLVITQKDNFIYSFLLNEKNRATELQVTPVQDTSLLGNIYVGFVENIVKNINAAFLRITDEDIAYCSSSERCNFLFGRHSSSPNLAQGDRVLVQVERDPVKTKQASVTGKLKLTGKYLILLHDCPGIKFSGKLNKTQEARILQILSGQDVSSYGFIVRTNAAEASEEQILKEAVRLSDFYRELCKSGVACKKGTVLYRHLPEYAEFLRDLPQDSLSEVYTDHEEIYRVLTEQYCMFWPEDRDKIHFYNDQALSMTALYNLEKIIREATDKKVYLNSGASLIIEPTETLTVIDVNTGKAVNGRKEKDETFYKINLEAATEAMRQIRLRNLSGMILIDFINMESEQKEQELIHFVKMLAKEDRVSVSVIDMTGLKLLELTRRRTKKPLHEVLYS